VIVEIERRDRRGERAETPQARPAAAL